MSKALIIADMKYKQLGEVKSLRELLKYLQYRDKSVRREAYLNAGQGGELRYPQGVSDHAKPSHRETRWVDRGMGKTYRQITNRAHDWRGRSVLARTWVISPDPELMRHVPEEKRFEIVHNVTEKTIERWYGDNGWGQPEYSYLLHDKDRASDGEQMAHAHVITPGTIPIDAAEDMGRVDHIVRRAHMRDLNRTVGEVFQEEFGRVLGKERAQEIIAERNARIERERDPGRERRERMGHLKAFADVVQLLQAEKAARDAKKRGRKRKRTARQQMAELRFYARYVTEERQKRREADWRRIAIARREQHEAELQQERERTRQGIERARAKRQKFFDILEEEIQKLEALRAYFGGLHEELERDHDQMRAAQQEIER